MNRDRFDHGERYQHGRKWILAGTTGANHSFNHPVCLSLELPNQYSEFLLFPK